jgi:glycosyltransferase involved in cell wall biosynthesis
MNDSKTKKVFIICAHEPDLDPRIRWVYESSSKCNQTMVVASGYKIEKDTAVEINQNLKIVRIKNTKVIDKKILFAFVKGVPLLIWCLMPFIMGCVAFIYMLLLCARIFNKLLLKWIAANNVLGRFIVKMSANSRNKISALIRKLKMTYVLKFSYIFLWFARGVYKLLSKWIVLNNALIKLKININVKSLDKVKIPYLIVRSTLTLIAENSSAILNYLVTQKVDILYANDFDTLAAGVCLKKIHPGFRLIYDCHEFYPYSSPDFPKWAIWLLCKIEKKMIKSVDNIITVNPMLAEQIEKAYKVSVHSLLNAEPIREWMPQSEEKIKQLIAGKISFIFQGGFSRRRGLEEVAQAWNKLNPKNAVLFFRGNYNIYRDELENYCKSLEVFNKSLFFLPSVSEDELVSAAACFDVGIIPYKPIDINYKYCCPNKFSQYLHSGLAIMTNNTEFIKQQVMQNQIGLVYDSSKIESIEKTITMFIENKDFLEECKANARRCAKTQFNWQVQEEKFYNILFSTAH